MSSLNFEQYAHPKISKSANKLRTVSDFTSENNLNGNQLPIWLNPSDPDEFKTQLLNSRLAEIKTTYSDGRIESKEWNAHKFEKSSNVLGNLRSRPEYRPGNWQANHIVRVDVEVKKVT